MPGPSLTVYRKRGHPVLRSALSAPPAGEAYTVSSHVGSVELPETVDISIPPPYEDYLQGNGANLPCILQR